MPKKGHSEEQIVGALQRVESGEKVGAVCRGLGISQATYYAWKRQYASLGVTGEYPIANWPESNR